MTAPIDSLKKAASGLVELLQASDNEEDQANYLSAIRKLLKTSTPLPFIDCSLMDQLSFIIHDCINRHASFNLLGKVCLVLDDISYFDPEASWDVINDVLSMSEELLNSDNIQDVIHGCEIIEVLCLGGNFNLNRFNQIGNVDDYEDWTESTRVLNIGRSKTVATRILFAVSELLRDSPLESIRRHAIVIMLILVSSRISGVSDYVVSIGTLDVLKESLLCNDNDFYLMELTFAVIEEIASGGSEEVKSLVFSDDIIIKHFVKFLCDNETISFHATNMLINVIRFDMSYERLHQLFDFGVLCALCDTITSRYGEDYTIEDSTMHKAIGTLGEFLVVGDGRVMENPFNAITAHERIGRTLRRLYSCAYGDKKTFLVEIVRRFAVDGVDSDNDSIEY